MSYQCSKYDFTLNPSQPNTTLLKIHYNKTASQPAIQTPANRTKIADATQAHYRRSPNASFKIGQSIAPQPIRTPARSLASAYKSESPPRARTCPSPGTTRRAGYVVPGASRFEKWPVHLPRELARGTGISHLPRRSFSPGRCGYRRPRRHLSTLFSAAIERVDVGRG